MQWTAKENRWVEVFQALKSYQLFAFDNIATASQYWIVYDHFLKSVTAPGATVLIGVVGAVISVIFCCTTDSRPNRSM